MKYLKAVFSKTAPTANDVLWIKPVDDGVTLYVKNGKWVSLKTVDDKGTASVADDKPKVVLTVSDITKIKAKDCNALNVGDQIVKKTGSGANLEKHLYTVTYKSEAKGEMCLNYFGRFNVEEVYYDKTGSSSDWAHKETNITPFNTLISG